MDQIGTGPESGLEIKKKRDLVFAEKEGVFFAHKDVPTRIEAAKHNVDIIAQSAKKKDSLGKRLLDFTTKSIERSSWLNKKKMPAKEEITDSIGEAEERVMGTTVLSGSQRTKRGKRFEKKAKLQAKMINNMNECSWQREDALKDLLIHGTYARIGADVTKTEGHFSQVTSETVEDKIHAEFLKNVGADVDEFSPMLSDLSFYYEQTRKWDPLTGPVTEKQYGPLEKIADPATRKQGYLMVLKDLEELDLSQFDYKDNDAFAKDTGPNSFVKRFATLRAFSHAAKMLRSVGMEPELKDKLDQLYAKADTINEILTDYENRAILLQSPYYTLLAGKDFDKFTDEDIKKRIGQTEDLYVRSYLKRILEKRANKGFAKGKKAKKIYEEKKKEYAKTGQHEPTLEEYVNEYADKVACTIDSPELLTHRIHLVDESRSASDLEGMGKLLLILHNQLHQEVRYRAPKKDGGIFAGVLPKYDWIGVMIEHRKVTNPLLTTVKGLPYLDAYKNFIDLQNRVDDYGARLTMLNEMKETAEGSRLDEIETMIDELMALYVPLRDQFLEDYEEFNNFTRYWQDVFYNMTLDKWRRKKKKDSTQN